MLLVHRAFQWSAPRTSTWDGHILLHWHGQGQLYLMVYIMCTKVWTHCRNFSVAVVTWEFPSLVESLKANQILSQITKGQGYMTQRFSWRQIFTSWSHWKWHHVDWYTGANIPHQKVFFKQRQTDCAKLPISGRKTTVPETRGIYFWTVPFRHSFDWKAAQATLSRE